MLYVHTESQYAVRFYAEEDGLNKSKHRRGSMARRANSRYRSGVARSSFCPPTLVVGRQPPYGWTFLRDVAGLEGRRRVWFLFSHVINFEGKTVDDPLDRYVATLDAAGTRRMTIRHSDAVALLYDLRR